MLAALVLLPQIVLNPPKPAATIAVDVELVNLLCTVRDYRGAYVNDLAKSDFEVREDGKRQEITHFAREVNSPMTVALLLDVSGSVERVLDAEKAAAKRFFAEVIRPGDQALLAGFAQLIAVWQDLTPSSADLQTALEKAGPFHATAYQTLETRPRGGTLLYDAIALVAEQKLRKLPGRKTMVVITDGLDNGSIATVGKALKAAVEADAVVYAIHYEDEAAPAYGSGMITLQRLSEPTGGQAFHVSAKLPLEAVFKTITEEMRNQYALGYPPPNANKDGRYHSLEVKLSKSGLKVQARTGYFAVVR
jgi:Ca-activated chloride channel family protein